ncbi:MAG: hypothetical protein V3V01_21145 [Acidimicrobiales bacterium]
MSLWTPDGEHQVDRDPSPVAEPSPASTPLGEQEAFDDLTPEQQQQATAMAEDMSEVQRQIAAAPASTVVANHAMGIYELAAIHLSQQPPNLVEAAFAIDAMSKLTEGMAGRLGEAEPTLREALAQIRLAFVDIKDHAESEPEASVGDEEE